MRKRRIIALALVAMMSVSLAAFKKATKPAAKVSTLSTHEFLKGNSCEGHKYITTQYSAWKLVEKTSGVSSSIVTYKYERTVTEVCTKCAGVKTHKEYKYEYKWFDLIQI